MESGSTLGPFEIAGLLGKGGMGEVYRARDPKLGRDVAIKVLPKTLAADPDLLARFEREAQTLASLNHSNIATVHGFEHDTKSDVHFLVMEYISGETLTERFEPGPLSISDALPHFIEIARGLDAAHGAGIVHRDLKPDNVKINEDGVVKILDFGIAKTTTEPVNATGPSSDAVTTPMSPVALTAEGTFLGTPVYMSPEQARGKGIDKRTDIWAFGCCLFEALTSSLPFQGDTIADTVGAILQNEPDWSSIPESTPEPILNLLHHCLEKDVRKRLSSAGDIALTLEDAQEGLKRSSQWGRAAASQSKGIPIWAVGIIVLFVVLIAVFLSRPTGKDLTAGDDREKIARQNLFSDNLTPEKLPIETYSIKLPASHPVTRDKQGFYGPLEISPDGKSIFYQAQTESGNMTMVRELGHMTPTPIPGTEASHVFSPSPSGQQALMYKNKSHWRISIEGGKSQEVKAAVMPIRGVWQDEEHVIITSPLPRQGLCRINLNTLVSETISEIDPALKEVVHMTAQVIHEKNILLYIAGTPDLGNSPIYAMNLESLKSTKIAEGAGSPYYTDSGHLLYAKRGKLMALPFDMDSLEATGPARDVAPPTMTFPEDFPLGFTITPTGDLIYVRTSGFGSEKQGLVWVDMSGDEIPLELRATRHSNIALTRSDTIDRILYRDLNTLETYLYNVDGKSVPKQLTYDRKNSSSLLWLDDGNEFAFTSINQRGGYSIYRSFVNKTDLQEELLSTKRGQYYVSASAKDKESGDVLGTVYNSTDPISTAIRIPNDGSKTSVPIFDTEHATGMPILSPDRKWLAYFSNELNPESGDVFVTSYPDLIGKTRVSTDEHPIGTDHLIWAPGGKSIYYRGETHVIRVAVNTENGFTADPPEELFPDTFFRSDALRSGKFALHSSGEKFLFIKPLTDRTRNSDELIVIKNWLEVLRNPRRALDIQ